MRISDWSSDVCSSDLGNAAQIDGTDFGPIGTNAICKGLRSACLTELMVDLVRVEGIGSKCIFARQQRKAVLRQEAKQQPFPAAVRAIATDRVFRFIVIDGERNHATLPASFTRPQLPHPLL